MSAAALPANPLSSTTSERRPRALEQTTVAREEPFPAGRIPPLKIQILIRQPARGLVIHADNLGVRPRDPQRAIGGLPRFDSIPAMLAKMDEAGEQEEGSAKLPLLRDALRMAEKLIHGYGQPAVAQYLAQQAEKNLQLLNQTVGLL